MSASKEPWTTPANGKPAPQPNGSSPPPPRTQSIFATLKGGVNQAASLVQAITAPVPHTPDGLTNGEAKVPSDPSAPLDFLHTIAQQAKDNTLYTDVKTLIHGAEQLTQPIDDRKLLLEEIVTMLGSLPPNSDVGETLQNSLIGLLWKDLQHPPATFLGAGQFRSADGGGNNPTNPTLGQSGTPYARSVAPLHPLPHSLPDPGVVFDALLKRDKFVPHPSGISSLLFSFATIIIHSCFQTSRTDAVINEASSYLDLSPLYGNNQAEQNTVRTFKQGELWPDVWASDRLGLMPPHVSALLVVFCRNHNFIVNKLFSINERGKFKPLDQLDEAGIKQQDEVLFQTARLINCGFFVNVVFYDYIRVILNQNRTESTWALFPNGTIKSLIEGELPRGVGNACSVEFNVLYRWHSAISAADEKWTSDLFSRIVPNVPFDQMTETDFFKALGGLARTQGADPQKWSVGTLKRQGPNGTGYFKDSEISNILMDATTEIAGAFKARGSPACMRIIDILGIATARNDWNTCSLNEFRKFLDLKPFDNFQEWNPDPEIWKTAEQLYTHVDNLELFPGLLAEEAKPSQDGSGLAPGYTISRAILSDAVALVRGDRYFTTDFTTSALTNWGFEDVQPVLTGGAFGGVIGKILMRTLPTSYTFNSIYALFPFSTPETTKANLTKLGIASQYDFSLPKQASEWHPAFTYKGCMDILADHRNFGVIYLPAIQQLVNTPYGFFIGFDDMKKHARDRDIMDKAMFPFGYEIPLKNFYESTMVDLIKAHSWSYDGNKTFTLDVVRDVTTIASALWVANNFGIPLKTDRTPHGLMTPQELYQMLSAFFIFVFLNFDPQPGFMLRDAAVSHAKILGGIISIRFGQVIGVPSKVDWLAREIQDAFQGKRANQIVMSEDARAFYSRLLKSERPLEELNASCQSIMTASTANQGEVAAHAINFYLDADQKIHYDALFKLAQDPSAASDQQIWMYVLESMRLDPQVAGIPRVANSSGKFKDGDKEVAYTKGDMIFASMRTSNRDPTVFPNPDAVDPTRDPSLYKVFGSGIHNCLGSKLVKVSMTAMVREVFKLKNVRRAPGPPGHQYRFNQEIAKTPVPVYVTAQASLFPFPVSLSIVYDA